jgi:hypothetical protein
MENCSVTVVIASTEGAWQSALSAKFRFVGVFRPSSVIASTEGAWQSVMPKRERIPTGASALGMTSFLADMQI